MANIIAIVWDFDKTLIPGYMQEPLFREYGVDAKEFWREVNALPEHYLRTQGVRVNPDTIYLNHILRYVKQGTFKGLNNRKLKGYGEKLTFYPGVPEIFSLTRGMVENDPLCQKYDIKLEHYIISTGLTEIIKGTPVYPFMSGVWGCEFIEGVSEDGSAVLSEIGYTIDNTTKTRALFEINKGVGMQDGVHVNTRLPEEYRRVHFINMVYIADGPSDIPAFSLMNRNGGTTFAVYPRGDMKAMHQINQLRKDGRVQMLAEADYSSDATAGMWLQSTIEDMVRRIAEEEKEKLRQFTAAGLPHHLT